MLDSLCSARVAHGGNGSVLLGHVVINLFMVESSSCWADVVALSHLEVFSEVLVTAPPIGVDHAESLVPADLMEVRVAHVILLAIDGESAVFVGLSVELVSLSNVPLPGFDHLFFLVFNHHKEEEGGVQVENKEHPHKANTVLRVERLKFPVNVTCGVLHEAGNVFECSPSLGVVTGLLRAGHEFSKVAVSLFGEGSYTLLTNQLTFQSCLLFR